MAFVALALSLGVAALGALGVLYPEKFAGIVRRFQTRRGLYAAAAIRVALGAALFVAAPASRAPEVLGVLGVLIFVAGLATPFLPLERLRRLLDLWVAWGPGFLRVWAASALILGLSLAYALVP